MWHKKYPEIGKTKSKLARKCVTNEAIINDSRPHPLSAVRLTAEGGRQEEATQSNVEC